MRNGTAIILVVLFLVILVAAVVQLLQVT